MATQYQSSTYHDGYLLESDTTWAGVRDATTAATSGYNLIRSNYAGAVSSEYSAKTSSNWYVIRRSYFQFDTSAITGRVTSAVLYIGGYQTNTADFFVVKGTQSGNLATSDYRAIDGWNMLLTANGSGGGNQEAYVTKYSDEIDASADWGTSGYNTITLNLAARADMKTLDTFSMVCINSTHDLRDVIPADPSTSPIDVKTGMVFAPYSGTTIDPKIVYGVDGFAHTVMGVGSTYTRAISGVATTSVTKVLGV